VPENGERGPQGDHGQSGETGQPGRIGQTGHPGQPGREGRTGDTGLTGETGDTGGQGEQGVPGPRGEKGITIEREAIHPWRWRALIVWIIAFSIIVGWQVRENRGQISDLESQRVSLSDLQLTNCGLKKFLLQARLARINAAVNAPLSSEARRNNIEAARGYDRLVRTFIPRATGDCEIPAELRRPIPTLNSND
jgi:hypothetical protein